MSNEYYTPTGTPSSNSDIVSNPMRAEFAAIGVGLDKMPVIAGNTGKIVVIGSGALTSETLANLGLATAASVAALIPSGTRLLFPQAAPPAGFTLVTTDNNRMLRLVNTSGGGVGGVDSPILMNKVPSHTHANTLNDPGHFHDQHSGQIGTGATGVVEGRYASGPDAGDSGINTGNKTTGVTISNVTNAGADNWEPLYFNVVIGQKT